MLDSPAAHLFIPPGTAPQPLADAMHRAWLAFAHHHNPNVPDLPQWPCYELHNRPTMIFDTESHVENDPQSEKREIWTNTALA